MKKETLAQVFSCEFCKIFKNTFFQNTSGRLLLIIYVEVFRIEADSLLLSESIFIITTYQTSNFDEIITSPESRGMLLDLNISECSLAIIKLCQMFLLLDIFRKLQVQGRRSKRFAYRWLSPRASFCIRLMCIKKLV